MGSELRKHLSAQYLTRSVTLAILDGTPIARREEGHPTLAQQLHQIVIEIAGLVGILKNESGGEQ